jgi:hypothetical protein
LVVCDLRPVDLTALNPSLGQESPMAHTHVLAAGFGASALPLEVVEKVFARELRRHWHNLPIMV